MVQIYQTNWPARQIRDWTISISGQTWSSNWLLHGILSPALRSFIFFINFCCYCRTLNHITKVLSGLKLYFQQNTHLNLLRYAALILTRFAHPVISWGKAIASICIHNEMNKWDKIGNQTGSSFTRFLSSDLPFLVSSSLKWMDVRRD